MKQLRSIYKLPLQLLRFWQGVLAELRLVQWLKARQVANYTLLVIVAVVVITLSLMLVDSVLVAARNILLGGGLI